MYLIDYDYAGYNFAAYDLANMINETSIDYSKPTYPGFEIMKLYSFEEVGEIIKHYPARDIKIYVCGEPLLGDMEFEEGRSQREWNFWDNWAWFKEDIAFPLLS